MAGHPDNKSRLFRSVFADMVGADELAQLKRTEDLERETMLQFLGNGGVAA